MMLVMVEVVLACLHFSFLLCHYEVHLQEHHSQCQISLYHFLSFCFLFVSAFSVLDLCISPLKF